MWFKRPGEYLHCTDWSHCGRYYPMTLLLCQRLVNWPDAWQYECKDEAVVTLVALGNDSQICQACWQAFSLRRHYIVTSILQKVTDQQKQRFEQEERARHRKALVASNLAAGKHEVMFGRLVLLQDLETQEESWYYYSKSSAFFHDGQAFFEGEKDILKLPANVTPLRCDTPVGQAIKGLFTDDEFVVDGRSGVEISYRILSVQTLNEFKLSCLKNEASGSNTDRQSVFSGRGRTEGNDSRGQDGSKYMGYMARDSGQWGSFPMHDDYGDEADAEGKDYQEWSEDSGI